MDASPRLNPTIPSALEFPRDLPELSRAERSQAIRRAFSQRARAFSCCLALLFLPSIGHRAFLGLGWLDSRTIVLMLSFGLFLRVVTLRDIDAQLSRWGNFACLYVAALLVYAVFPTDRGESEWVMNEILICTVVAGAFSLQTLWFLASAGLFASFYAIILVRFYPGAEASIPWLKFALVTLVALVVQRTQARLCAEYNEVTFTDEARLALYAQAAEDARKAQRRFEKLSNGGKEALIFHAGGKIVDANGLAAEMLATTREQLMGEPVAKVLGKNSSKFITHASDPKNNSLTRLKILRADGSSCEALGFNHEMVFADGAVSVLGLRPYDRKMDTQVRACACDDETQMN